MGPAAPYSQAGRRSRSFGLMETGVANTALDAMRLKPACDAAGARWKHAILRRAGAIAFDGCNRGFGAGTMTRVVRRSVDQQHFGTTRPVRAGRLCSEACSRGPVLDRRTRSPDWPVIPCWPERMSQLNKKSATQPSAPWRCDATPAGSAPGRCHPRHSMGWHQSRRRSAERRG